MKKQDPFDIPRHGTHYLTGQLVGGYVSQQTADYLRLLAVYKSDTIQSVLQGIIDNWMETQEPIKSIIETLVDRTYMEWVRRKCKINEWEEYEREIIGRLERRKIPLELIQEIIQEMRSRVGKKR